MIPCLGVLVLNRGDLLLRLVDSIDVSVERLCIVQNGKDDIVETAIDQIARGRNPMVQKVYLERPFRNMGVAPAWNSIIKSFPECDYWLIANNDTVFLPGDLSKYHGLVFDNPNSIIAAATGAFNCFTITPKIVADVGLFDENIWPIYSEDVDYFIRAQRAGIDRISLPSNIGFSDDGSWTIKSNAGYAVANHVTQSSNGNYVMDKWGHNREFPTPWNHPSRDRRDWWYDPYRRRSQSTVWQNFENTSNRIL
jgi:GT2 family glycosyltransferase